LNQHKGIYVRARFGNAIESQMITLLLTFLFSSHPIHVSVSEITYSEKDKALQIITRLFIDDLELSIQAARQEPSLDILAPKNNLTTEQLVKEYLNTHLKIKVDGKNAKTSFLGLEREDVALVCYIEIENVKRVKSLDVFCDAIMETHSDQSNLVHVTYKGPIKSARLTREQPSATFKFEFK